MGVEASTRPAYGEAKAGVFCGALKTEPGKQDSLCSQVSESFQLSSAPSDISLVSECCGLNAFCFRTESSMCHCEAVTTLLLCFTVCLQSSQPLHGPDLRVGGSRCTPERGHTHVRVREQEEGEAHENAGSGDLRAFGTFVAWPTSGFSLPSEATALVPPHKGRDIVLGEPLRHWAASDLCLILIYLPSGPQATAEGDPRVRKAPQLLWAALDPDELAHTPVAGVPGEGHDEGVPDCRRPEITEEALQPGTQLSFLVEEVHETFVWAPKGLSQMNFMFTMTCFIMKMEYLEILNQNFPKNPKMKYKKKEKGSPLLNLHQKMRTVAAMTLTLC
ncbi:hypothetical protein TREES_T100000775 [Tupaia chinensis]|uniref:Uncharacterized protein n=1 Tax=Tupaia chinensis TaxID=246437 RepID=L9KNM4_TUPCH|nr:hypothetical protein TREES_T100000775 [Tupaia chinensis]